ncbi:MAG: Histidinol-phosphatase [candidate division WS2 bacterium]|uniref:Histidinol-phosphatase n=1 Tax=Psychracetigena formicireducens TaxID=2986056 RepID=A0A9E2BGJ0_PSYF1|nr:Histidinol-phosphatase [Candidatus Psychracetigena formicireducens]MBT9145173.1 Histidinol-phosphatase [Candidatus Psychracetigena formicireducens]
MLDLHIHTKLCGHAVGEMEEYIEVAINKEFEIFGFSDHLPHEHIPALKPFIHLSMPENILSHYVKTVLELKEKYSSKLDILLGIEVDYDENYENETRKILSRHPFDYAIGSIHVLGDWLFDSPRQIEEWNNRVIDEVYSEYYRNIKKLILSGLFNIVGHLDLPKKFNHRPRQDFEETMLDLAKNLKNEGMVVEINISGLRYAAKEMYPSKNILSILKTERVDITFGSDAHEPKQVGENFSQALRIAQKLNFSDFAYFKNRKKLYLPLNETTELSVLS